MSWYRDAMKRFWDKTSRQSNGCLEWQRSRHPKGYGRFRVKRGTKWLLIPSHRMAWELANGRQVEPGPCSRCGVYTARPQVCHTCDNPPCCDPEHLWLGCNRCNMADRDAKGRRTAPRGERHRMAKLTNAQAEEIRSRYTAGKQDRANRISQKALAREFGVDQTIVSDIIRLKAYF